MSEVDIVAEWFKKAKEDFDTAYHLFYEWSPKQIYIIAFHCQQCAEKSLKAFLVFNSITPENTHHLPKLCQECIKLDADFSQYMPQCAEMNPYSAASRYPEEPLLTETMAERAVQYAGEIYRFCKEKVS